MVDRNVVAAKLAELADRIARVREHCPADPAELTADRNALDLVSFNLLLAIQSCLDLASHLIADEGWEPSTSLAGAFVRLQEHGVISEKTSAALRHAAGFRNLIAHGYASAAPAQIHEAAVHGPADMERFAREVSAWVNRQFES